MDSNSLKALTELAGSLTLSVFLLFAWYKEREERIARTDAFLKHMDTHIEKTAEEPPG
jgi:hypothetical protein